MHNIITISAILACAAAAPGFLFTEEAHVIHTVPLTSKSTITKSSQLVDHGSTYIHHTPIIPVVHATPIHVSAKSTVTKSSQVVNHGGTAIIHAPVHSVPVHVTSLEHEYHVPKSTVTNSKQIINHGALVHAPLVQVHSSPVYYSSPVVVKTGDSAVSHQSSTVHETVPVVSSVPVYAVHH